MDSFESIGELAAGVVGNIEIIKPANRAEWLAARKRDVTASDASALLGIHPYTTSYELWAQKTGRKPDEEDNEVFRRGRALEFVAIDFLREDYPDWKITHSYNNRYFRDPVGRIGATPDAFVTIPGRPGKGIIQIKSASDFSVKNWIDPETKQITPPLYVAVQALIEAELTKASYAMVALIVSGHGMKLHPPIDIPLTPALMTRVRAEVADFWRVVAEGRHPAPDWKRDGELLEDLYQPDGRIIDLSKDNLLPAICDEKARIASEKSAIDKRLKEIRAELLDKMGGASAARISDGRTITAKTVERAGYEVKPTSYIDLRVKSARL
ncbi:endonuclease [Mesorhizobium sp. M1A.F.Ca.IN.020.06.1.1]|uniref:YqaJ viral recombinase family nuclease n=2 Tax=Mesorhizobium TaxID=68287 RepID=UPI000FCBF448|nr:MULTISPECIES: YqaJ viral recombinase family protein [unclassified Mesorhizobium]RUV84326.1 endonuclease [Mesorhizobium sp. M1A.F.Ca.IN.020.32.1.1]RUW13863.1 endonuclease [Mesorhizobium sp. M1A.F.Ca.IN.022.05.2.1]RUW32386.1 endonuclease [Mesorhizobium sp. M1A.F.Ca.IN.020.06.1.1]RWG06180.1 MAG: endonuclease [Mesorhizobium sp.]RWG92114.1 MAG: endonuclease [Mesorhizobium sp.]